MVSSVSVSPGDRLRFVPPVREELVVWSYHYIRTVTPQPLN